MEMLPHDRPFDYYELFKRYAIINIRRNGTKSEFRDNWRLNAAQRQAEGHGVPKSFDTYWRALMREIPPCNQHVIMWDNVNNVEVTFAGEVFPASRYPASRYKVMRIETRTALDEIVNFHKALHPERVENINMKIEERDLKADLFVDGVQFIKSSVKKTTCQLVRFEGCEQMYNLTTIVHFHRSVKSNSAKQLSAILESLKKVPFVVIDKVIADLPQRIELACTVSHNGEHGCLYCVARGEPNPRGHGGFCWPFDTVNEPLRDDTHWRNMCVPALQSGISHLGLHGYSSLLDIPGFRIEESLVLEPMHALFAGVTRTLYNLTTTYTNIAAPEEKSILKTCIRQIDNVISQLVLPSEIDRPPRDVEPAHYKTNEWKVIVLLSGVRIADVFHSHGLEAYSELWWKLTYILRSSLMNDEWHNNCENHYPIHEQALSFYLLYEKCFGKEHCSHNIHLLSHLQYWRGQGRLHRFSAERAEHKYGKNKECQEPRNRHTGKQVHTNTLVAMLAGHRCVTGFSFYPQGKFSGREDSIIVDECMRLFRFMSQSEDGSSYRVKAIQARSYVRRGSNLVWGMVGVFVYVDEDVAVIEDFDPKRAKGKGVRLQDLIIVWTNDMQKC